MWSKLQPALIRALRTFIQTFLGVYLAGVTVNASLETLTSKTIVEAALAAAVVALLMNIAEQLGGVSYNRG